MQLSILPDRQWRPVPGHEGYYLASDYGEAYSCRSGRLLALGWQNAGYAQMHFWLEGRQTQWLAHRLVATLFLPNPDGLPEVNHIDGNKRNNVWRNLEWCTRLHNVTHAVATGLHDPNKPKQRVVGVSLDGFEEVRFPSMKAADMALSSSGKNGGNVSLCVAGKTKHAYGYVWRRA